MPPVKIPRNIKPDRVRVVLVGEGLPTKMGDYFYSASDSLYVANTLLAFRMAGRKADSVDQVVEQGVYLTVAVKAIRKELTFSAKVIEQHSFGLEEELGQFHHLKALLLMGDAAIKALNFIAKRQTGARVIPAGSTYKIRKTEFYFMGLRVFPSYLQTGKNFLIEKAKQKMVAEDIRRAFQLVEG